MERDVGSRQIPYDLVLDANVAVLERRRQTDDGAGQQTVMYGRTACPSGRRRRRAGIRRDIIHLTQELFEWIQFAAAFTDGSHSLQQ